MTQTYRTWIDIAATLTNPFQTQWTDVLSAIGMDASSAFDAFTLDFETAQTQYTDEWIVKIFQLVYHTNSVKYSKLVAAATAEYDPIENYNMAESSEDVRTPDLTSALTLGTTSTMTDTRGTSGTTTTTNKINQSRNTTEAPNNFTETSTHKVNPYDNPGFTDEYSDTSVQSGSKTISESYSGNADETTVTGSSTNSGGTSTANTGTNTSRETGTDTTTHSLTRKGNVGVTTSQQMVEQELTLADKMNIFKIIEQDIAAKLFLQVW